MNLHTTLKAYNEAVLPTKEQLLLNEAENILKNAEAKELNAISFLGMDKNISVYNKKQAEISEASQFDEVYDIAIIRKMAIDYGLRFLPSNYYRGTIDPLMPSMVNQFVAKHKIKVKEVKPIKMGGMWDDYYNNKESDQFFILAPAESFGLKKRPKDPIIFYKINNTKYAFIHKWGNDLSARRKFTNFFCRTSTHISLTFASFIILLSLSVFYITRNSQSFIILCLSFFCLLIGMECDGNSDKWNSKYL